MATKKYAYAVGRRKESTAVVKLFKNGTGTFTVTKANGKKVTLKDYFGGNWYMLDNALRPFLTMDKNLHKGYDAEITIR
jgi:ribosomal protein S9